MEQEAAAAILATGATDGWDAAAICDHSSVNVPLKLGDFQPVVPSSLRYSSVNLLLLEFHVIHVCRASRKVFNPYLVFTISFSVMQL
jgi:hypothetical protein